MRHTFAVLLALALVVPPAAALPPLPQAEAPEPANDLLVDVATKSQKAAARRACRAKWGNRLAYVSFGRNSYTCHYRKSNKTLTREAARDCRKSGRKLGKVVSIKIKGSKSVTRYTCVRR